MQPQEFTCTKLKQVPLFTGASLSGNKELRRITAWIVAIKKGSFASLFIIFYLVSTTRGLTSHCHSEPQLRNLFTVRVRFVVPPREDGLISSCSCIQQHLC